MRAVIKGHYISDNEDLSTYEPTQPQVFGFILTFAIGPENSAGQDFFEILVASAAYLAKHYSEQMPTFMRHIMLASDYNVQAAVAHVSKYISTLEEDSWEKLVAKIGRMARWEYEDYRP